MGNRNLAFNFSRHGIFRFVAVVLGGWFFSFFFMFTVNNLKKDSYVVSGAFEDVVGNGANIWARFRYINTSWLGVVVQQQGYILFRRSGQARCGQGSVGSFPTLIRS